MSAPTVTFRPAAGSRLLDFAATVRTEYLDELRFDQHDTRAYVMGSLEGELAFAVSADPDCAAATVCCCQDALLLRIGLSGDGLTLEQQRLRGWIVGLLGSLSASFDTEE